jgi:chromosome segregation protein
MRLKCIKLAGFKSFVDPTSVNFPSNLCAVVGPNGCGKSNIIDAVRWVMGESSAKNLRGESMTDVIFNGSGGRKPVGQASIELVFDNSDGSLGGEYARYAEIAIKRKVTRDGLSDYYLNGQKCRRRDITDIFLGTGLGPRSYAIIEQGMISKLIEAKPEELRVFLEEAAGISKYKERRRDTENRMRRTRENLERLTDIRDELERQLQHLKRQAAAAERYKELKQQERLLKAQLQALQWKKLDEQSGVKQAVISELELKVEEHVTRQTSIDAEIEKHISSHTELGDRFNEIQGRFYKLGAEIARAEQTIQHQQERSKQLADDLEQTTISCREAEEHLITDKEKLENWQSELLEIEPELEIYKDTEEASGEYLQQAEEAMHNWQTRWDEFNGRAAEARQKAEVQQSRIQHIEQALQRLMDRIQKLEEESQSLHAGPVQEEIDVLVERVAELDLQAEEQQIRIEGLSEKIDFQREENSRNSRQLDEQRSSLQRQRGRFASLEALQQAALGQKGGAVSAWLKNHELEKTPRLAEGIKVEKGYETALETVLGSSLQAVCVNGLDAAAQWVSELEKGSLTLFDTTAPSLAADQASGTLLLSKISGDRLVSSLLAGIHVVDTLVEALAMRTRLSAHESVITKDGIWIGPNWLRVARDTDEQAGVLQRQQELETLEVEIARSETAVEELDESLSRGRQTLRELEQQRELLQKESKEQSSKHSELRSQLSAKQVRVEQIAVRRKSIQQEIEDNRRQYSIEQENTGSARLLLQEAIEAMEKDSDQRENLLRERDDNRSSLDQARQRARHDKDHSHQLALRHQSLCAQVDAISQTLQRTRSQVEQLMQRRSQLENAIADNSAPLDDIKSELESQLEKRLKVEDELAAARRNMEAAEQQLRDAEQRRARVAQDTQVVRSNLEKERLEAQTLEVRRNTLQEQLTAAHFELDSVIAELPEDASEQLWQEEIEKSAARIQRLGAINLAAIDEYQVQSERKAYLDTQDADLVSALEMLENAIRKIDRETRSRFKETFDQVNSGLQELFPKVFGGGHAYLEMTGEDLLDTGIAIMARPPGKRNSTIHLLSGGEKALTAIALVFSIFRLNPAPFCMLDEVDAPLDDANVGRYARMVKEMSSQVQFIYITHNKIAMEMAEQLMGVTMHEPGVSRMVTVDVDEAAELAAV